MDEFYRAIGKLETEAAPLDESVRQRITAQVEAACGRRRKKRRLVILAVAAALARLYGVRIGFPLCHLPAARQ